MQTPCKIRKTCTVDSMLVSGIFVDPRYNVILTEPMIQEAKNCLLQTYARLEKISNYPCTTEHNSTIEHMSNDPDEDEFEQLTARMQ